MPFHWMRLTLQSLSSHEISKYQKSALRSRLLFQQNHQSKYKSIISLGLDKNV